MRDKRISARSARMSKNENNGVLWKRGRFVSSQTWSIVLYCDLRVHCAADSSMLAQKRGQQLRMMANAFEKFISGMGRQPSGGRAANQSNTNSIRTRNGWPDNPKATIWMSTISRRPSHPSRAVARTVAECRCGSTLRAEATANGLR